MDIEKLLESINKIQVIKKQLLNKNININKMNIEKIYGEYKPFSDIKQRFLTEKSQILIPKYSLDECTRIINKFEKYHCIYKISGKNMRPIYCHYMYPYVYEFDGPNNEYTPRIQFIGLTFDDSIEPEQDNFSLDIYPCVNQGKYLKYMPDYSPNETNKKILNINNPNRIIYIEKLLGGNGQGTLLLCALSKIANEIFGIKAIILTASAYYDSAGETYTQFLINIFYPKFGFKTFPNSRQLMYSYVDDMVKLARCNKE